MKNYFVKISIAVIGMFLYNCSSISYEKIYPTLGDGKYDSEFPYKSTSDELGKISETIQRVNSTAFYKIYVFDEKNNFTLNDLKNKKLDQIAIKEVLADNSASGTAAVVYSQNGNIALLTCAHIITFPDTIIAYRFDENGIQLKYVESISLKEKQIIYVAGFPEGSEVEVLAQDNQLDIALIGRKFGTQKTILIPTFSYPFGKAKEVDWGTFVYLLGYPINNKMITKAIVSSPNKDESGSFLVDAVINPGFSGGLVLAIRDGVPNFELIGIVQWVPEEDESMLYPENLKNNISYNPVVPYKGNLYVRKHRSIRYGIARVIPVETISNFLSTNKTLLAEKGFYISQ